MAHSSHLTRPHAAVLVARARAALVRARSHTDIVSGVIHLGGERWYCSPAGGRAGDRRECFMSARCSGSSLFTTRCQLVTATLAEAEAEAEAAQRWHGLRSGGSTLFYSSSMLRVVRGVVATQQLLLFYFFCLCWSHAHAHVLCGRQQLWATQESSSSHSKDASREREREKDAEPFPSLRVVLRCVRVFVRVCVWVRVVSVLLRLYAMIVVPSANKDSIHPAAIILHR